MRSNHVEDVRGSGPERKTLKSSSGDWIGERNRAFDADILGFAPRIPAYRAAVFGGLTTYDGVPPRTPVAIVIAAASIQAVPAFSAEELVFTSAAEQLVAAILAHKDISARTAEKLVVAIFAHEDIPTRTAAEDVVAA